VFHLLAVLVVALSFLLGSIPFGLIIARLYGTDIRTVGSGNIGMTNVWRTLGWKAGSSVLLLDTLKGFAPVLLVQYGVMTYTNANICSPGFCGTWITQNPQPPYYYVMLHQFAGIAAILGHTFTPWLRFKGGKGVATGLGVAVGLYQLWIVIPLAVFLLVLLMTRMVSLSSIIAVTCLALMSMWMVDVSVLWGGDTPYWMYLNDNWWFGLLAFLLILYTHRSNIKRIMNGSENKVSFGRKQSAET
jgi:acyl phosphate:glycerol-3-phosphate acyltransferase